MAIKLKNKKTDDAQVIDNAEITEIDNKKDKKAKKEKSQKAGKNPGSKKGGKIVPFLVFLILAGAISGIMYFDVLGARTKYVMPLLEKVPFINNLIKEQEEQDTIDPNDPYANMNKKQLSALIASQQAQIDRLNQDAADTQQKIKLYTDEIDRLKGIEDQQLEFKRQKEEFDTLIAQNDPQAYSKFYESINPENAEKLYKEAVGVTEKSKAYKSYIAKIEAVDDSEAAKILEELSKTDMDLTVNILNNIKNEKAGSVIAKMDTRIASRVVKRMTPATP